MKKRRLPKEFNLPAKAAVSGVIVSIYDEAGCCVRGYDSIISVSPALIILDSSLGKLHIKGSELSICDTDNAQLTLYGRVIGVQIGG